MWLEGFREAFSQGNILWLVLGTAWGMVVGVLPALGSSFGVALMVSFTFAMDPVAALIFLCAIHAACVYGDSVTSILINVPGSVATVASAWDGYPMAEKGLGGRALGIAAIATLIGASVSWVSLILLAKPITKFAMMIGGPEYFALGVMALSLVSVAAKGETIKGLIMALCGLALSCIGEDPVTGVNYRFSFGVRALEAGIPIVIAVLGTFAVSQVLTLLEQGGSIAKVAKVQDSPLRGVVEVFRRPLTVARATVVGWYVGMLPALGMSLAGITSYLVEKNYSRERDSFGKASPAGLLAAEVGKGACAVGDLIPTFTLGVPGSVTGAILMAALVIHGVQPGPRFLLSGVMPYTVFAGLLLGLVLSAAILLFGGKWLSSIVYLPNAILAPTVVVLCFLGAYAQRNYTADIIAMVSFGVLSYLVKRVNYSAVCMILGLILGPIIEANFHRSLGISFGAYSIFLTRPIAAVVFVITGLFLGWEYLKGTVFRLRYRSAPYQRSKVAEHRTRNDPGEIPLLLFLATVMTAFLWSGRAYSPRVRLFPTLVCIFALALIGYRMTWLILEVGKAWRFALPGSLAKGVPEPVSGRLPWVWTVGLMLGYLVLVYVLGFILASAVFLLVTGLLAGYRRKGVMVLLSIGIVACVWGFARFVHLLLPIGAIFR